MPIIRDKGIEDKEKTKKLNIRIIICERIARLNTLSWDGTQITEIKRNS